MILGERSCKNRFRLVSLTASSITYRFLALIPLRVHREMLTFPSNLSSEILYSFERGALSGHLWSCSNCHPIIMSNLPVQQPRYKISCETASLRGQSGRLFVKIVRSSARWKRQISSIWKHSCRDCTVSTCCRADESSLTICFAFSARRSTDSPSRKMFFNSVMYRGSAFVPWGYLKFLYPERFWVPACWRDCE